MDILKKFCDSIRSNALFNERDRILLAVSGGVDSVVMLDLFSRIQDRYNLDLRIIHLNHGLRGELADRDEEFVKTLGARYSYRVIAKTVDTASYARKRKMSLENAARTLRYKFYEDLVRSENATAVAVGHNQNDQAETFLDHLTRGSGIKGLVGMKIRRGYIIRPLLTVTRVEIQTFAKKHGIQHVVDHTNLDKKYKRNRIRHELIPYLENNFNPGIIKSLFNTTLILKDADFYLENQARESLKHCIIYCKKNKIILDINQFFEYFKIIQVYVLYYVLTEKIGLKYNLNFEQINILLSLIKRRDVGKKFKIDSHWEILIDRDGIVFRKSVKHDQYIDVQTGEKYKVFGGDKEFYSTVLDRSNLPTSFPTNKNIEYIDFDLIEFPLEIRSVRIGDQFTPINFRGRKKVSDFFTDNKIPLHMRDEFPLLACKKGIIWIIGLRLDDHYKVSERTKRILRLELRGRSED